MLAGPLGSEVSCCQGGVQIEYRGNTMVICRYFWHKKTPSGMAGLYCYRGNIGAYFLLAILTNQAILKLLIQANYFFIYTYLMPIYLTSFWYMAQGSMAKPECDLCELTTKWSCCFASFYNIGSLPFLFLAHAYYTKQQWARTNCPNAPLYTSTRIQSQKQICSQNTEENIHMRNICIRADRASVLSGLAGSKCLFHSSHFDLIQQEKHRWK